MIQMEINKAHNIIYTIIIIIIKSTRIYSSLIIRFLGFFDFMINR